MINRKMQIVLLSIVCVAFTVFAKTEEPSTAANNQLATNATAQQIQDPVVMLKQVTTDVLAALKQHKGNNTTEDLKWLYHTIDAYVFPHVDFDEMSQWVAGRTVWGKASEKTRNDFIAAFKVLVVKTYAATLNSYSGEKVEFGPQKIDTSKDRIQVTSTIIRQGKENVRLDFRLVKRENAWYVYDIVVEGISILQGFQAQFSDEIRSKGLEPVIAKIKAHNEKTNA